MEISTERLSIVPMTLEELEALVEQNRESDPEMSKAYSEMLAGCREHPDQYLWYTAWKLLLTENGRCVGDACFKGLGQDGHVEIGYGVYDGYIGRGIATEGTRALCLWALEQPAVTAVEAETDPGNAASQRILAKIGFVPTGTLGEEGPRFILYPKTK